MDMSNYSEPLETELEQIADEVRRAGGLGPVPRGAVQGISDMQARVEYHTALLTKLRGQPKSAGVLQSIAECEDALADAKLRIREYEVQRAGQN